MCGLITGSYCFNLPIWKETNAKHKATKSWSGFQEDSEEPNTVWQLGFPFWFMTTHKWFLFNGLESSPSFKLPVCWASALARVLGRGLSLDLFLLCGRRPSVLGIWHTFMLFLKAPPFPGNPALSHYRVCALSCVGFTNVSRAWNHGA